MVKGYGCNRLISCRHSESRYHDNTHFRSHCCNLNKQDTQLTNV